jgi:NTE family protein
VPSNTKINGSLRRFLWRARPPVLALGGGGARGFAHFGVLEVLEELKLPIRAMAGTSMGAVAGAMYLAFGSAGAAIARWQRAIDDDLVPPVRPLGTRVEEGLRENPLLQVARRIRDHVVIAFAVNRTTVLDNEDLDRAMCFLIPEMTIDELPMPFVAVATDLADGREVALGDGDLRQALKASGAIPGLLPPVEIGGRSLVDGGVVAEVPVAAARSLGWPVVAVDVSMELPEISPGDLALDTMMRTQMMTSRLARRTSLEGASAVLRPRVGHATWADWGRFGELVEAGRRATRDFFAVTG